MKPNVITVANSKGGSCKSSLVTNLAAALAERGRRTLIIDLDSQATQAASFGVRPNPRRTIGEVLLWAVSGGEGESMSLSDVIVPTGVMGIDLAPSLETLARTGEIVAGKYEVRWTEIIANEIASLGDRYTDILIDTAPASASPLNTIALVASTGVILTVVPASESIRRALETLRRIEGVRGTDAKPGINPNLAVIGILPVQYVNRSVFTREILEAVGRYAKVLTPGIPRTFAAVESTAAKRTLLDYTAKAPMDSAGRAAADGYRALAAMLLGEAVQSSEEVA
jgi:chromosome partitioning protein